MYDIYEWYDHDDNYYGGSWGTGFLYLDKGYPEWAGNSSVESFKMGDGDGIAWKSYYLEVTGYDENTVYLTAWHN